jgi:DNA invertase Pin-like site-specific DNA recombinase
MIAMQGLKIPDTQIYMDKQSGKNTARPGLQKMLATVRDGDTVVVESVSRFARNAKDLLDLIDKLSAQGVEFVSQKEHIDTTTPTGKFMLTVFAAVAELERGCILQRQAEGIAAAQERGVRFGRPQKEPPNNFNALARQWECGKLQFKDLMAQTGMTKSTLYRRLREYMRRENSLISPV